MTLTVKQIEAARFGKDKGRPRRRVLHPTCWAAHPVRRIFPSKASSAQSRSAAR